ncbi:MAG: hypothetical protein WCI53_03100 [Bacteroidota bacterium]|jgi:hypothetical protein
MKKIFLSLGIIALIVTSSCKKETAIEGPELVDIFGEFKVLEPLKASIKSPDFSLGNKVVYSTKLSIRTSWTIEVIGLNSGARKVFSGNDKDFSTNQITWNGSITFAPFFRKNEPVVARMTFENYPDTLYSDTIKIAGARPTPTVDILIDDFESPQRAYNTFTEGQQSYNSTAVNYSGTSPAEKTRFFALAGNHGPTASLFICGMGLSAKISQGTTDNYFKFSTDNPKKVFFNAYVYGWGDNKSELSVEFQEDDNLDGTYQPAEEGTYNYRFKVDWLGWKLVSFNYDETKISTSGGFGNTDRNGKKELDRISAVQFLLLAQAGTSGATRVGLDFASFTYFTPFQP